MTGRCYLDSKELEKPKLCRKDAMRFQTKQVYPWACVGLSSWGKAELHEILAPNQVPEGVGN
jgi:hypothetical protein